MIPGTLSEFIPKSWFHPRGIYKVIADITPRLPDVSGSLFLTFTINLVEFSSPESAFDYARKRLRKLFYKLRKGVKWDGKRYQLDSPYCVKVEFHENGWPHFHVIFLTKRYLPSALLNHLWGMGRTNVKRISNEDFNYLLKYVTKGGDIPEWVLKKERIRIFQTSKDFYAVPRKQYPPKSKRDSKEANADQPEALTIEQRLVKWEHKVVFHDMNDCFATYDLTMPYQQLLGEIVFNIALAGRYLGRGQIKITSEPHFMALEPYIKCKTTK
ncbi:rolling circle replication-associated protein [Cerasicoccus fimbriatus]|uniref:rolling circle replication-associated protein n=1 Tax=Cerasicoccus fimbriatus TaxID=3014554 RepID=UPI0022B2EA55|nr:hypothetical protein [Cerasicoccus sp. TK19100]